MPEQFRSVSNLALSSKLVVSTEDADYPKANLIDNLSDKLFKFTATSGNIVIDSTSAVEINFVSLINTNIGSAVSVTLQRNATDSWGSPSFSVVLDNSTAGIFKTFTANTYRFSRIVIATNSAIPYIGQVWIGMADTFTLVPKTYQWGFTESFKYHDNAVTTDAGQIWRTNRYKTKDYSLSIKGIKDDDKSDYEDDIISLQGGNTPFCFVDNDSVLNYCVTKDDLETVSAFKNNAKIRQTYTCLHFMTKE